MPKPTRTKILDTARRLFNQHGVHRVGVREIARAVGITPGNLSYHFATKDDLVTTLVMQLHGVNADTAFANLAAPFSLISLYRAAVIAMRNMLRYRFVISGYADAVQHSKELQRLEATLRPLRAERSAQMIAQLVKGGFVRRRVLESQYLVEQGGMISSGWLNAAALDPRRRTDREVILHYAKVGCALFEPYCTARGARQMRQILGGHLDKEIVG